MTRTLLKEVEIATVGDLKMALEIMPDEVAVCDAFEEPLMLSWYRDNDTGEESIEFC